MSLRSELSVVTVSAFLSLYPGGKNALMSWATTLTLGFPRGVVDVTLVSAASVVGFEEGHLARKLLNYHPRVLHSSFHYNGFNEIFN